jgi:3-methyladenine DNA glycosylase AlkD
LIKTILAEIRSLVSEAPGRSVPVLRQVRRQVTKRLTLQNPSIVLGVVRRLLATREVPRWFAYELVHYHRLTMAGIPGDEVEQLGEGLSSWEEVDSYACYVSGPVWREGGLPDHTIHRWAASPNRWWRRAALVSTVALNNTARGGQGDPEGTLEVCELLKSDRDDMVVKALSWALRELARKHPAEVAEYVNANEAVLAPRVLREVRNKLTTGLKNPRALGRP